MTDKFWTVDIKGYKAELPIMQLANGANIAFFNLHGNQKLTEHCAKELAKLVSDCDVLITAESKGLQLTHCVARNLNQDYYAVARKSKKLYMQDGLEVTIDASITTGKEQKLYLSHADAKLLEGKKVAIIDDVIATGESLQAIENLAVEAGAKVVARAAILAELESVDRKDIIYLKEHYVFRPNPDGTFTPIHSLKD